MLRPILLVLAISCLLGCGLRTREDARILRLGHASVPGKPLHAAADVFKETVEKLSDGRLVVEVYPQGQLGDARLLMESVVIGTLDMTADAPLSGFVREMALLDLPYLFIDSSHAAQNLDGDFGKALAERAEAGGIVVLSYWTNGSRYIFNREREIKSPEDLSGLKIRVPEGKVWIEMMNRLGALATPLSWGEVYTAIEQGVIAGAESDPISMYRAGFHETCKHVSRTQHVYAVCPHIINKRVYDSLCSEFQRILRMASQEASRENRRLLEKYSLEASRKMEDTGVKIVDVDRRLFQLRVLPMRDRYAKSLNAQDLVELLTEPGHY
jgi:TRAP-type transport system periplasmic protein